VKIPPQDASSLYGVEFYTNNPARWSRISRFFLGRRAAVLERTGLRQGDVLEVGAGLGEFGSEMIRRGFRCVAVEPSSAGRDRCDPSLRAVASLLDIKNQLFDVATFWHSLEHMDSPFESLSVVHSLLRPRGVIIVSVPNVGSWEARSFGEAWFHFDVPRHVLQLNRGSLTTLLKRAGFEVEQEVGFLAEYDVFGMVQSCFDAVGIGSPKLLYHYLKHGLFPTTKKDRAILLGQLALLPTATAAAVVAELALSARKASGTLTLIARRH
jgi:SAM-dependent methyltransferase